MQSSTTDGHGKEKSLFVIQRISLWLPRRAFLAPFLTIGASETPAFTCHGQPRNGVLPSNPQSTRRYQRPLDALSWNEPSFGFEKLRSTVALGLRLSLG